MTGWRRLWKLAQLQATAASSWSHESDAQPDGRGLSRGRKRRQRQAQGLNDCQPQGHPAIRVRLASTAVFDSGLDRN